MEPDIVLCVRPLGREATRVPAAMLAGGPLHPVVGRQCSSPNLISVKRGDTPDSPRAVARGLSAPAGHRFPPAGLAQRCSQFRGPARISTPEGTEHVPCGFIEPREL